MTELFDDDEVENKVDASEDELAPLIDIIEVTTRPNQDARRLLEAKLEEKRLRDELEEFG